MLKYDIIIFGAGIAGLSLAWNLRKRFHVIVLDRVPQATQKVGEALIPASRRILRDMELLEDFEGLDFLPYFGNWSKWGKMNAEIQDFIRDPDHNGWFIDRVELEKFFVRKLNSSGVNIQYNSGLDGLSYENQLWHIKLSNIDTPLYAPLIVDATGRRALIKRHLTLRPKSHTSQLAYVTYLPRTDDELLCRIETVPNGWFYTAPMSKNQRVLSFHKSARNKAHLDKDFNIFEEASKTQLMKDLKLTANNDWHIHPATTQSWDKSADQHWFSVGDAAFSVDPLSSAGMFNALYTAIMAQNFISTDLTNNIVFNADGYNHLLNEVFYSIKEKTLHYYRDADLVA